MRAGFSASKNFYDDSFQLQIVEEMDKDVRYFYTKGEAKGGSRKS